MNVCLNTLIQPQLALHLIYLFRTLTYCDLYNFHIHTHTLWLYTIDRSIDQKNDMILVTDSSTLCIYNLPCIKMIETKREIGRL